MTFLVFKLFPGKELRLFIIYLFQPGFLLVILFLAPPNIYFIVIPMITFNTII